VIAGVAPSWPAHDIVAVPGFGVEGTVDGERYRLGRPDWVARFCAEAMPQAPQPAGVIVVALASRTRWLASLRFGERLRDGASALVQSLRSAGLEVSILSGDRAANVSAIADDVGVDDWRADASPDDKRAFIAELQRRKAVVAMVGDGLNDAPSLARADVSIAHGDAAALTQWTADVVVTGGDLAGVAFALAAARRTLRVIRQNLGWALAYNALAIPLAAAGHLPPLAAAAGMSASSLFVVGNAWRLSRLARGAPTNAAIAPARPSGASIRTAH
jgi:Cu2+-exporting ATPase